MNEENWRLYVGRRREKPRPQFGRTIPTIASQRKDDDRSKIGFSPCHQQSERALERVPNNCHVTCRNLGLRAQKGQTCQSVAHLPSVEQAKLQCVPRGLAMGGIHEVNGIRTLIGGQANSAPEQIKELISMASEHWSENVGLRLVRPEPLEVL